RLRSSLNVGPARKLLTELESLPCPKQRSLNRRFPGVDRVQILHDLGRGIDRRIADDRWVNEFLAGQIAVRISCQVGVLGGNLRPLQKIDQRISLVDV